MKATGAPTVDAGSEEALARSAVYRLLSQVFSYPTPRMVGELRQQDLPLAVALSSRLPDPLPRAVRELAERLRGVPLRALERQFNGLFTHVHSADCPPYETDFTTRDVFRQSQELADLGGFYRAFGVEPARAQPERLDHVAVELEFLHLLSYKEAWALARGEEQRAALCQQAQVSFLAGHLLRWVPEFARRVAALAPDTPYGAAARLTTAFLAAEAERLGVEVRRGPVGASRGPDPGGPALDEAPALCEGEEP
ncbi:MAG TPA: molecular chaperone TorD family protein [Actinomycetota bacterium]|nr:molecular chaperone TorD family protein [Actinomycetota bacterium]